MAASDRSAALTCMPTIHAPSTSYDHVWRSRTHLLDRTGQRLRVIAIGELNSALVEFEDGWRCVVSRFAYRHAPLPA